MTYDLLWLWNISWRNEAHFDLNGTVNAENCHIRVQEKSVHVQCNLRSIFKIDCMMWIQCNSHLQFIFLCRNYYRYTRSHLKNLWVYDSGHIECIHCIVLDTINNCSFCDLLLKSVPVFENWTFFFKSQIILTYYFQKSVKKWLILLLMYFTLGGYFVKLNVWTAL